MRENRQKQSYRYIGAIHIHTTFSDGTGNIDTITRAAKRAGLDYIIITDHNNFDIEEGIVNGVYVIKGEEISPSSCNHYLALGINKIVSHNQAPQEFVNEVRNQGGFGFAAHPDESETRKNIYHPIRWTDKNVTPDGIEIWNWFSAWGDGYCSKNIFTQAYSYFFRDKLISKPNPKTLEWWDKLNSQSDNIVPAIGGVDAHALMYNNYIILIKIFSYESMFKTIANAIVLPDKLSEDFEIAKEQILRAVKRGNNLIFNRKICREIPEISITNSEKTAGYGESLSLDDNTFMEIKLGKALGVKIILDREVIFDKTIKEVTIQLKKSGKYRVEVSSGKLGYAYSNPILVE